MLVIHVYCNKANASVNSSDDKPFLIYWSIFFLGLAQLDVVPLNYGTDSIYELSSFNISVRKYHSEGGRFCNPAYREIFEAASGLVMDLHNKITKKYCFPQQTKTWGTALSFVRPKYPVQIGLSRPCCYGRSSCMYRVK